MPIFFSPLTDKNHEISRFARNDNDYKGFGGVGGRWRSRRQSPRQGLCHFDGAKRLRNPFYYKVLLKKWNEKYKARLTPHHLVLSRLGCLPNESSRYFENATVEEINWL